MIQMSLDEKGRRGFVSKKKKVNEEEKKYYFLSNETKFKTRPKLKIKAWITKCSL